MTKKTRKPRTTYSQDFKSKALILLKTLSLKEVSKELNVQVGTLRNWINTPNDGSIDIEVITDLNDLCISQYVPVYDSSTKLFCENIHVLVDTPEQLEIFKQPIWLYQIKPHSFLYGGQSINGKVVHAGKHNHSINKLILGEECKGLHRKKVAPIFQHPNTTLSVYDYRRSNFSALLIPKNTKIEEIVDDQSNTDIQKIFTDAVSCMSIDEAMDRITTPFYQANSKVIPLQLNAALQFVDIILNTIKLPNIDKKWPERTGTLPALIAEKNAQLKLQIEEITRAYNEDLPKLQLCESILIAALQVS